MVEKWPLLINYSFSMVLVLKIHVSILFLRLLTHLRLGLKDNKLFPVHRPPVDVGQFDALFGAHVGAHAAIEAGHDRTLPFTLFGIELDAGGGAALGADAALDAGVFVKGEHAPGPLGLLPSHKGVLAGGILLEEVLQNNFTHEHGISSSA